LANFGYSKSFENGYNSLRRLIFVEIIAWHARVIENAPAAALLEIPIAALIPGADCCHPLLIVCCLHPAFDGDAIDCEFIIVTRNQCEKMGLSTAQSNVILLVLADAQQNVENLLCTFIFCFINVAKDTFSS
jgi:hypothetical protein